MARFLVTGIQIRVEQARSFSPGERMIKHTFFAKLFVKDFQVIPIHLMLVWDEPHL
jgi:hypothetical protein